MGTFYLTDADTGRKVMVSGTLSAGGILTLDTDALDHAAVTLAAGGQHTISGQAITAVDASSTQKGHMIVGGTGTSTQAFGDSVVAGAGTGAANVAHKHAMPADPVTAHDALASAHGKLLSFLAANTAAVNNSVTVVDSGLSVTVPVAGTYALSCVTVVSTAANADFRWKFTGTATLTTPAILDTTMGYNTHPWNTEFTNNGGAFTDLPFTFSGIFVVTVAGTFKVQFAQMTADVSDTKMLAGSFLKLDKVA